MTASSLQNFDFSFMAARMVEQFEAISANASAGHTDAVNYETLSPKAKMLWAHSQLQRLGAIQRACEARTAELIELLEEQVAGDE